MESEIGTFLPEVRQRCSETRSGRSNLPQPQPALTMGPKIMRIRVHLVSPETLLSSRNLLYLPRDLGIMRETSRPA
jgi:hypothetical protein